MMGGCWLDVRLQRPSLSYRCGVGFGFCRAGISSLLRVSIIRLCRSLEYPGTPPQELTHFEKILDNPDHMIGYFTWFLQSSTRSIMDDCLVSGGKVLGGIARARRVLEAYLRL